MFSGKYIAKWDTSSHFISIYSIIWRNLFCYIFLYVKCHLSLNSVSLNAYHLLIILSHWILTLNMLNWVFFPFNDITGRFQFSNWVKVTYLNIIYSLKEGEHLFKVEKPLFKGKDTEDRWTRLVSLHLYAQVNLKNDICWKENISKYTS